MEDVVKARAKYDVSMWSLILIVIVLGAVFFATRRVIDRRRKAQWAEDEAEKRRQLEKQAGQP